jgi:hypothetical protein
VNVISVDWGDVATWVGAAATFLAVLIALYGDAIKSRMFRPELHLHVTNRRGVAQPTQVEGQTREARYYHFRVSNPMRWPAATGVQVFLLQIEEPDAAGVPHVLWSGELPFVWQHQHIYPLARNIGPAANCDFLQVIEAEWVHVLTAVTPLAFPFDRRRAAFKGMIFTVQARSAESDGAIKRFRVSWNKRWAQAAEEMERNLVIEDLP